MEKDEAVLLLEKKSNEIIASKKLVVTSRGPVWFLAPIIEDKLVSKSIYDAKLQSNINSGIPTAETLLQEFMDKELWSIAKDKNLEVLPDMISEMKERLARERNKVTKKKLTTWYGKLQDQYMIGLTKQEAIEFLRGNK